MSKFFKEEQTERFKLSEYLEKDESEFIGCIFNDKDRKRRTAYVMDILGDVSLDKKIYETFMTEFQSYGGKYDVRTKPETIKGIYEITDRYPELSSRAIKEIWFTYINDLFEEYSLTDMLGKYIELHGQTDDAVQAFIDFVERKAEEFDAPFKEDAKKLDSYKEEYGETFIERMQRVMQSQHIALDDIEKALPESELVKKDQEQLNDIATRTRCFFGMCLPISTQMTISLASGDGLDDYPDQPAYVVTGGTKFDTTFTKQEFLDSVKKQATDSAAAKPAQYQKK